VSQSIINQFMNLACISWNACWVFEFVSVLHSPLKNTEKKRRWYHLFSWVAAGASTAYLAALELTDEIDDGGVGGDGGNTTLALLGAPQPAQPPARLGRAMGASILHESPSCTLKGDSIGHLLFEVPLYVYLSFALCSLVYASARLKTGTRATLALRRRLFLRHSTYVVAFVLLWVWQLIHRFIAYDARSWTLQFLSAAAVSSQGLLFACIRLSEPGSFALLKNILARSRCCRLLDRVCCFCIATASYVWCGLCFRCCFRQDRKRLALASKWGGDGGGYSRGPPDRYNAMAEYGTGGAVTQKTDTDSVTSVGRVNGRHSFDGGFHAEVEHQESAGGCGEICRDWWEGMPRFPRYDYPPSDMLHPFAHGRTGDGLEAAGRATRRGAVAAGTGVGQHGFGPGVSADPHVAPRSLVSFDGSQYLDEVDTRVAHMAREHLREEEQRNRQHVTVEKRRLPKSISAFFGGVKRGSSAGESLADEKKHLLSTSPGTNAFNFRLKSPNGKLAESSLDQSSSIRLASNNSNSSNSLAASSVALGLPLSYNSAAMAAAAAGPTAFLGKNTDELVLDLGETVCHPSTTSNESDSKQWPRGVRLHSTEKTEGWSSDGLGSPIFPLRSSSLHVDIPEESTAPVSPDAQDVTPCGLANFLAMADDDKSKVGIDGPRIPQKSASSKQPMPSKEQVRGAHRPNMTPKTPAYTGVDALSNLKNANAWSTAHGLRMELGACVLSGLCQALLKSEASRIKNKLSSTMSGESLPARSASTSGFAPSRPAAAFMGNADTPLLADSADSDDVYSPIASSSKQGGAQGVLKDRRTKTHLQLKCAHSFDISEYLDKAVRDVTAAEERHLGESSDAAPEDATPKLSKASSFFPSFLRSAALKIEKRFFDPENQAPGVMDISSFADAEFADIRIEAGLTVADIVRQLDPIHLLQGSLSAHFSDGASSSFFCKSLDNSLIVKTIAFGEVEQLVSMLPAYHRHLARYPGSMICRFYGCFSVKMPSAGRIFFILMGNVLPITYPGKGSKTFDLKGSTINRRAREAQNELSKPSSGIAVASGSRNAGADTEPTKAAAKRSCLFQDEDFRDEYVDGLQLRNLKAGSYSPANLNLDDFDPNATQSLSASSQKVLLAQLKADINFLRDTGSMDFSVLLHLTPISMGSNEEGLTEEAIMQMECQNLDASPSIATKRMEHGSTGSIGDGDGGNQSKDSFFDPFATSLGGAGAVPQNRSGRRMSTGSFYLLCFNGAENVKMEEAIMLVQGAGCPPHRALTRWSPLSVAIVKAKEGREWFVLQVGVIDVLTTFTAMKKVEATAKAVGHAVKHPVTAAASAAAGLRGMVMDGGNLRSLVSEMSFAGGSSTNPVAYASRLVDFLYSSVFPLRRAVPVPGVSSTT
jgi:hypothetical protein